MKLIVTILLLLSGACLAQVGITAALTPVTVDFTGYAGAGFAPSPAAGQLDSDDWAATGMSDGDLAFAGTATTGDFARGSSDGSGVTTGGFYALDASGNSRFMIQPGGSDWAPGDITLRIQNNTGQTLIHLRVTYDIYINNDQDRANSFNFSHSSDDASYTDIPTLDYTSPEVLDASGFVLAGGRDTGILNVNIANGAFYYLRWSGDDVSGSGSRDEFALDDIVITAGTSDNPLPVSLTSFTAIAGNSKVTLRWVTASEQENVGFKILRSNEKSGNYEQLATYENNPQLEGQFNSSTQTQYKFEDQTVVNDVTYWYKLVDVDVNGVHTEHGSLSATPHAVGNDITTINVKPAGSFALHPNYPNPFNPSTTLRFDIPALSSGESTVEMTIFNAEGQKVKTLFKGILTSGTHELTWNGDSDSGELVSSGAYFAILKMENLVRASKMLLIK
jgi:hypothetical protein